MRFLDIFLNREQAYEERRQILFLKQRLQIYEEGAKDKRAEFCAKVIDVVGLLGDDTSLPIIRAILQLCQALLQYEGHLYLPNVNRQPTSTADMWRLRAEILSSLKPFEEQNIYELLLDAVCTFVKYLTEDIPRISSDDKNDNSLAVPLYALLRNPAYAIERLLHMPYQDDLIRAELFEHLRVQFDINTCLASGINPDRADKSSKALTLPTKADISPIDLIDTYLAGTPFSDFLQTPLPFSIPFRMRFEHTHIVGGTGHGKTQLLQHLILRDIDALSQGHGSIIVIDSQGDMLRNILQLAQLSPAHKDSIANRLILIDPNDVEHPPALNLFDFGLERLSRYAPVEQEKLINGAIALYEYVFGALLGADLTQRQGVIFRYLARLIMTIPGATIHTLMRFMEESEETRGVLFAS